MKRLLSVLVTAVLGLAAFPAVSPASNFSDYFTYFAGLNSGAIAVGSDHGWYTYIDTGTHSGYNGLPGVYIGLSNGTRASAYATCDIGGCVASLSWSAPGQSSQGFATSKNHGGYFSYFDGYEIG